MVDANVTHIRKGGVGKIEVTVGDVNGNGRLDLTVEVWVKTPLWGEIHPMDVTSDVPVEQAEQAIKTLVGLAAPMVTAAAAGLGAGVLKAGVTTVVNVGSALVGGDPAGVVKALEGAVARGGILPR